MTTASLTPVQTGREVPLLTGTTAEEARLFLAAPGIIAELDKAAAVAAISAYGDPGALCPGIQVCVFLQPQAQPEDNAAGPVAGATPGSQRCAGAAFAVPASAVLPVRGCGVFGGFAAGSAAAGLTATVLAAVLPSLLLARHCRWSGAGYGGSPG